MKRPPLPSARYDRIQLPPPIGSNTADTPAARCTKSSLRSGMSAANEGGRRNMLLAGASFAWLGVAGLLPGKSARWCNIMTEKKKHPGWFRQDLGHLLGLLEEKSIRRLAGKSC